MKNILFIVIFFVASATMGQEKLSDEILKNKKEDVYYTGLPALALSPDLGFVYGVLLIRYNNGSRDNPAFKTTPYLSKYHVLAVDSTKGFRMLEFKGDFPHVFSPAVRLQFDFRGARNIAEQYFGVGENETDKLRYPTELGLDPADNYEEYDNSLRKRYGDQTYARYNLFHQKIGWAKFRLLTEITDNVHIIAGMGGKSVTNRDYSGDKVDSSEGEAIMAKTKLSEDKDIIRGYEGERTVSGLFGLAINKLDYEPDPQSGFYLISTAENFNKLEDAESNYRLIDTQATGVFTVSKITYATRWHYTFLHGNAPFYDIPSLGGRKSLRGFRQFRLRSKAAAGWQNELRFRITTLRGMGQHFLMMPFLFNDNGRVYDKVGSHALRNWKHSGGFGLKTAWNQATVIAIEYAALAEEKSLYVDVNHAF